MSKSSSPTISIITPAYNAAHTLTMTIDSVRQQSLDDWELLIIDDASTDNTRQIAEEAARKDSRIRILEGEGHGVSHARNVGLEAARGRYITFLDADDTYYEGALVKRLDALRDHEDWRVVHCITDIVDPQLEPLGARLGLLSQIEFTEMWWNPVHLNSVMGEADVLRRFRFPEQFANGEDWLYNARVLRSGVVYHQVPEVLVTYRMHPDSTVQRDFIAHENNLLRILDLLYGEDPDSIDPTPEYRYGLNEPPKAQIILLRRVGLLTWLLLSGDPIPAQLVSEMRDGPWDDLAQEAINNQIQSITMRYFSSNTRQWEQDLRQMRRELRKRTDAYHLDIALPAYYDALTGIVNQTRFKQIAREFRRRLRVVLTPPSGSS